MAVSLHQPPMSERDLLAICDKELRLAEQPSDVSNDRIEAMEYYLGRPYGKLAPREGHSKLTSRMLMDVIEWVLPYLCRLFCGNPRSVSFTAMGPDDVELADQETDYLSHVFWNENTGFLNLYSWLKDGLMLKDGYVCGQWETSTAVKQRTHTHLTREQLEMLLSDESIEPVAFDSYVESVPMPRVSPVGVVNVPQLVEFYDVVVNQRQTKRRYKLTPVPPEECRISNDVTTPFPNDARCFAWVGLMTRSDLVEMGIPREVVDTLPGYGGRTVRDTREKRARHADIRSRYDTTYNQGEGQMEVVEIRDCYIRVDWDNDGIAERRRVMYSGKTLLMNDWVPRVPYYHWSPILMPHRHNGISYADVIKDLHEAWTVLQRIVMDGLYQTVAPETVIDVNGVADVNEWYSSVVGGLKRATKPPKDVFAHKEIPFSAEACFPVFELIKQARMERTGTGPDAVAQDPQTLQNVNTGVAQQALSMATERLLQVARMFAEVGLRDLWLGMHEDMQLHQDQPKQVELSGKWVTVDPRTWKTREHMNVNVGLGAGTTREQLMVLGLILEQQKEMYADPKGQDIIVTDEHIFHTLERMIEASGLGNLTVEYFFRNPTSPEAQAVKKQRSQQPSEADKLAAASDRALQVQVADNHADNVVKMGDLKRKLTKDRMDYTVKMTELELESEQDVPGSAV